MKILQKLLSTRGLLFLGLLVSISISIYATYYKIKYWGFSFSPKEQSTVWTIDAHISFIPDGNPIKVSLSTPKISQEYKILSEDVVATKYKVSKDNKNNRIIITSDPRTKKQNLYYRIMLYDNENTSGKTKDKKTAKVKKYEYTEQEKGLIENIWALAQQKEGTNAEKIILLLNDEPLDDQVATFLPLQKDQRTTADKIIELLAYKNIPARIVRGVKLSEHKKDTLADYMVEVYENDQWLIYDIDTAKSGLPKNFVIFQRGGESLLDVSGGVKSKISFSVMKSLTSSFKMAGKRAKYENSNWFDFTIYNLPVLEQNTLKWLMIFPLGILIVVLMRNIVGISTMGTFTPMLIAMSLVKTGFIPGLVCFGLIIGFGLAIRTMLTRLNLLLVPRTSAVVIFVILIMQLLTVIGYNYDISIASSAIFFPIIITAWIIERASITWEEDGPKNAAKQILNSMIVAIFTYFIISNEFIRHIMFAFNEWNLVILFIVMLIGTYTGYRLTELKRFAPLVQGK